MKISASILALIAFVAIFMAVLTEARLGRGGPVYSGNPNGDEVGFRRWGGPSYSGNPNGDEEDEDVGGYLVSFL